MSRRLQRLGGGLLLLQGLGHSFIGAPTLYDALSQDAIWFAGAGLGMGLLGLLNLKVWERDPCWYTIGANGIWLILMVGLLTTSRSIRVVSAVTLTATCFVGSVWTTSTYLRRHV